MPEDKGKTPIQSANLDIPKVDYPLEYVLPDLQEWPLNKLSLERESFVQKAMEHSLNKILQTEQSESLSEAIAKVLYLERQRVIDEPWKVDPPDELDFWDDIRKKLLRKSLDQSEESVHHHNKKLLKRILERYMREITSNFKIPTYKLARLLLPRLFSTILTASKGFKKKQNLKEKLQIVGQLDTIRELAKKGTIVLVPTHFSNLDSVLIGWAADRVGLPAFSYGAGINLYNTKLLEYGFPRLGAYGVDRRKKNNFYLEALKTYSQLTIERGVHSLFFPGGTRSRSGELENKLKMGLLGTTINAQGALYEREENNKIFIVPLVLNYHFVLEAKNLIESYLKRTGKELYLVEKRAIGGTWNLLKFFWKFFSTSSEIVVNFGQPMDVLGNFVNAAGDSFDKHGKKIDLKDYFKSDGVIKYDSQRNAQYTKHLAKKIAARYRAENIVLSSHLVAYTAFNIFVKQNPALDLYGILRLPVDELIIKRQLFNNNIEALVHELRALAKENKLRISDIIKNGSIEDIIIHGVENVGTFHVTKALFSDKNNDLKSEDIHLLLYYHNRLKGYNISHIVHVD